jgi:hypothetical protein
MGSITATPVPGRAGNPGGMADAGATPRNGVKAWHELAAVDKDQHERSQQGQDPQAQRETRQCDGLRNALFFAEAVGT